MEREREGEREKLVNIIIIKDSRKKSLIAEVACDRSKHVSMYLDSGEGHSRRGIGANHQGHDSGAQTAKHSW